LALSRAQTLQRRAIHEKLLRMEGEMSNADQTPLFEESSGFTQSMAWACVVYSLVPFLGLIFVPAAFVFAFIEISRKREDLRRNKLFVFPAAAAVAAVQLVLWWLLYVIPDLGR
jgi:hypothetical protein